jgi:hypothetical protein
MSIQLFSFRTARDIFKNVFFFLNRFVVNSSRFIFVKKSPLIINARDQSNPNTEHDLIKLQHV